MFLSKTGKALDEALRGCHEHFPDVEIPLFVVMPNHFHAIICVSSSASDTYRPHNHGRLNQLARLSVATCGDPTGVGASGSVTEAETTDKTATPCRKYPRADFHDYNGGMYFVTVCTHDKCKRWLKYSILGLHCYFFPKMWNNSEQSAHRGENYLSFESFSLALLHENENTPAQVDTASCLGIPKHNKWR